MKVIALIILVIGSFNTIKAQHSHIDPHNRDTQINFDQIYPLALRGEMLEMFEILNGFPEDKLSASQDSIKELYHERFIHKNENFDYNTDDIEIIELFDLYIEYWNAVCFQQKSLEKADQQLKDRIFLFMQDHYDPKISRKYLDKNSKDVFNAYFKSKGINGLASGKTGHLFDLYIWKSEEHIEYDIKLPDGSVKVPVVFMKNFISNGWSHYTTLGKMYSGGWAKKDKLFCVDNAYDRSSESFRINYLSHEGQHFQDYESFPKLQQRDLEYRAKLAQLALGKHSVYQSIGHFIGNSTQDKTQAHPFANYCVIRDLSKAIFQEKFVDDLSKWEGIPVEKINEESKSLLKQHTSELNKLGRKKVKVYIE